MDDAVMVTTFVTTYKTIEVNPHSWLIRSFRAAGPKIGTGGLKSVESSPLRAHDQRFPVADPHFSHESSGLHGR
jgi:hypothetical protein